MLGNALLEVFPKSFGPVIKLSEAGALEWSKMRWGLPGPLQFGGAPVTNIRDIRSAHWRPLLGSAHRCLVPFTAFGEYEDDSPKGKKQIRWFAPPDRCMLYFAGIWREWTGTTARRKSPMSARIHSSVSSPPRPTIWCGRCTPRRCRSCCAAMRSGKNGAAPADQIETIHARILPADALDIISDEEAAQYVGGYLKQGVSPPG